MHSEKGSNVHMPMRAWFTKKGGQQKMLSKFKSKARRRWFVMDDKLINYFESKKEKKCKGNIYIQSIKEVKTHRNTLLLTTDYRTFSLTAEDITTCIEWAEGVECRLKDTEAVRKVVTKASQVIQKSLSIEMHSRKLQEYVDMLELENMELVEENERMKVELEQRERT